MKRLVVALCLVCPLAGCLGAWGNSIKTGWTENLKGKSIEVAIDRMGVPQSERTIAGHHVYSWVNNGNLQAVPCKIDIEVDEQGLMTQLRYDGALMTCDRYIGEISKK